MSEINANQRQLPGALQPHLQRWNSRNAFRQKEVGGEILLSKMARTSEINATVKQLKANLENQQDLDCRGFVGTYTVDDIQKLAYLEHEMSSSLKSGTPRKLEGLRTFEHYKTWIAKNNRDIKFRHWLPEDIRKAMQHDVVLLASKITAADGGRVLRESSYGQNSNVFARFGIDLPTFKSILQDIEAANTESAPQSSNQPGFGVFNSVDFPEDQRLYDTVEEIGSVKPKNGNWFSRQVNKLRSDPYTEITAEGSEDY